MGSIGNVNSQLHPRPADHKLWEWDPVVRPPRDPHAVNWPRVTDIHLEVLGAAQGSLDVLRLVGESAEEAWKGRGRVIDCQTRKGATRTQRLCVWCTDSGLVFNGRTLEHRRWVDFGDRDEGKFNFVHVEFVVQAVVSRVEIKYYIRLNNGKQILWVTSMEVDIEMGISDHFSQGKWHRAESQRETAMGLVFGIMTPS